MEKIKQISLHELVKRNFEMLDFEGEFLDWFGQPESNFRLFAYGGSGSGKSYFTLKLADYLTNFGNVFYNSTEEGIKSTFKERTMSVGVKNLRKIQLFHKLKFEQVMSDEFRRKRFKTLIIDSVQDMELTKKKYKLLTERYAKKVLIFISQVNGDGGAKGGTDLLHDSDIKMNFLGKGIVHIISRYNNKQQTVQLYKPDSKIEVGQQLPLITG